MSGIHWWKKEVTLRRPRGTVVVAKPVVSADTVPKDTVPKDTVLPADLVERAAALFDELETDLGRSSLHELAPAPPLLPVKAARPADPAGSAPPALPAVWPQALVDPVPPFRVPDPAPLPLDETPVTVWPPVRPFPVDAHIDAEPPGANEPFDSPFLSFDPGLEPEPEPEPEHVAHTPAVEWPPFVLEEPAPELEPAAEVESEPEPEPEPEQAPPPVEPVAKKPLFKRELHLPRRRAGKEKTRTAKVKRPRQSIWERNLSLPSLRRGDSPVKLVGLRVGSTQLSAAHVSNNGSIELLQLARSPLLPGLISGGEVREPDALAAELKTFFAQHKLPRKGIRLGVASNRIGVRVLELPVIDDPKAFSNAIRFRAQELLPIPVTDAVLDHVVLGEYVSDTGDPMRRVLLAFAHRDLVDRHAAACQKAGLKLIGVDLDAFALLRSLSEPRSADTDPTQAVVAVAIGHERTVFAVSDGLICDFVRVLEWGGSALDSAIAHSLDLSPSLAHAVKHQLDLVEGTSAVPDGLSPVQVAAAREAVRDELRVLSQEIVSSLRFYQTRPGSLAIGELLLTGGASELPGLAEELERLVGVPVRAADPFGRVHLGKKVKRPAEAGSYAVAIGLGIES